MDTQKEDEAITIDTFLLHNCLCCVNKRNVCATDGKAEKEN